MPTYDLQCRDCDTTFEVFRQGFLREEDRACDACGSGEVEQLFTGFVLGGSSPGVVVDGGGPSAGGCCGGSCGCGAG